MNLRGQNTFRVVWIWKTKLTHAKPLWQVCLVEDNLIVLFSAFASMVSRRPDFFAESLRNTSFKVLGIQFILTPKKSGRPSQKYTLWWPPDLTPPPFFDIPSAPCCFLLEGSLLAFPLGLTSAVVEWLLPPISPDLATARNDFFLDASGLDELLAAGVFPLELPGPPWEPTSLCFGKICSLSLILWEQIKVKRNYSEIETVLLDKLV